MQLMDGVEIAAAAGLSDEVHLLTMADFFILIEALKNVPHHSVDLPITRDNLAQTAALLSLTCAIKKLHLTIKQGQ